MSGAIIPKFSGNIAVCVVAGADVVSSSVGARADRTGEMSSFCVMKKAAVHKNTSKRQRLTITVAFFPLPEEEVSYSPGVSSAGRKILFDGCLISSVSLDFSDVKMSGGDAL